MLDILFSEDYYKERRIIGEHLRRICLLLVVVATFVAVYKKDAWDTTSFEVFAIGLAVLAILRCIVYPFWVMQEVFDGKTQKFKLRQKSWLDPTSFGRTYYGYFGTGEVLLGNFGGNENITYNFFCLFYMPIIPLGCVSRQGDTSFKRTWSWKEVIYLYLRQWSLAVLILSSFITIVQN